MIISRAINGISLNGDEYLLDDDGEVMQFKNGEDALTFLNANGFNFKNSTDAWDNGINIREE